jgi:hypothetical protein
MNEKKNREVTMIVVVLALISLMACAVQKGPILVGATYEVPQGLASSAHKVVMGLTTFQDVRGGKPSVVGVRETNTGQFENDLVVQDNIADLVTAAFGKALKARKMTVKDLPTWDLNIENMKTDDVDIVLGGTVTSLWTKVVTEPLKVTTHVDISVHAVLANARDKTVIRTLDMHGTYDRRDITFDPDRVGQAISSALSSMIDQFMNDPEFKKKVQ